MHLDLPEIEHYCGNYLVVEATEVVTHFIMEGDHLVFLSVHADTTVHASSFAI
jgi:hypothetical protein